MDNIKNYLIVAVAVVAVVFGVVIFQKVPVVNNQVNVPEQQPFLGAIPGNEVQGNEFIVGGVKRLFFSSGFNSASSTDCMFKTQEATSTLIFASAKISSTTLQAVQYEWGKSANQNATTTSLGLFYVASGLQATMYASTTYNGVGTNLDTIYTFAPYTYLTLKDGTTAGVTGSCRAEFIVN